MKVKTDEELEACDKEEALKEMKTLIKQVNTATKNIETTTFIKNVVEQIISKSLKIFLISRCIFLGVINAVLCIEYDSTYCSQARLCACLVILNLFIYFGR